MDKEEETIAIINLLRTIFIRCFLMVVAYIVVALLLSQIWTTAMVAWIWATPIYMMLTFARWAF